MADSLSPQQRHHIMSSIHATSTKPELRLRKELWKRGLRYRINDKRLAGSPDIVLPKYRTVIFVHGCFWHGHKGCKMYSVPKTNTAFWLAKVARNQERDQKVWRELEAKGWAVVMVWECELNNKHFEATVSRVEKEIHANGQVYQQHREERKRNRQQRITERRGQMDRHDLLLAEIKDKIHIAKELESQE